MSETKALMSGPPPSRRQRRCCSRTGLIIIGVVIAVFIVALAVGLGVGISRRNSSDDDDDDSTDSGQSGANSTNSTMGSYPSTLPSYQGLWQPQVNASWQIILNQPLALDLSATTVTPNVDVFDIDMFGNSNVTIEHLHSIGKKVICYFSAGSYEPGRPDSSLFTSADKGAGLDGWPGEYWLNLNSSNVRSIMTNRIATAASKGCDAIDPDNVDGYNNVNGLGLTQQDSINYVNFLAATAATYHMSTGLKNAGAIIPQVINSTAFSVNEQCVQYSECGTYAPYVQAGKPVFHIEYPKQNSNTAVAVSINVVDQSCATSGAASGSTDFSTAIKNIDLDGWVQYCNGQEAVTPISSS